MVKEALAEISDMLVLLDTLRKAECELKDQFDITEHGGPNRAMQLHPHIVKLIEAIEYIYDEEVQS